MCRSNVKAFAHESGGEISALNMTLREADAQLDESSLHGADALPAHVVLVDTQGRRLSLDEAGRQLDCFDSMTDANHGHARSGHADRGSIIEVRPAAPGDSPSPYGLPQIERVAAGVRAVLTGKVPRFCCEYVCRSAVEERWHLVTVTPLNEDYPTGAAIVYLDITAQKVGEARSPRFGAAERKIAENRIAYLNRVHAMLSGINTLIVHERDRKSLMKKACRIAVLDGGLRLSMMAFIDPVSGKVLPVALACKDRKLRDVVRNVLLASEGMPTAMVKRAVREKRAVVSNDAQLDATAPGARIHAEFGVCSAAIFPLIIAHRVIGILSLYADECHFFHEEQVKLLSELTDDVAFAIDHSEKRERLDYLASYDVVTGLANRSLFMKRVAQLLLLPASRDQVHALLMIDLHAFRNVNDSLGRVAGDALLRQVGAWLSAHVERADLVSRVGVDHFAVVLPGVEQSELLTLLEKLVTGFANHAFLLNRAELRISARAGVALFPYAGTDAGSLLKHAEAALKKAKYSGDRFLIYTRKMTEAVAGKLTLESRLHQALDKDQFVLYYQPKMHLASGRVTGVEALIRWNDPQTGLVMPERFIGILEEKGMIREVGRWVLRKAVADHLRWRRAGLNAVRIAVNVSPLQLRNAGFVKEVEQVLSVDPLAAAGLELEMTETLVMEDIRYNIECLDAIRSMGVRLAIDDFGTGFSSLSYLAKLPVHALKIDRSFVSDITTGREGVALVSTIVKLGHSMNLNVVAEGVETERQSRLLRLLKCDEIQGYLTSVPLPGKIFEARFLQATQTA